MQTLVPAGGTSGRRRVPTAKAVFWLGLPIVALWLLASPAAPSGGMDLPETFAICTIVLALARHSLLLSERTRMLEREKAALDGERKARREAEKELQGQTESQQHYRREVEVFDRLTEQLTSAFDEEELIEAATRAIARLVANTGGDVLLVNPSQDRVTLAAAWGGRAIAPGAATEGDASTRCPRVCGGSVHPLTDARDEMLAGAAHPLSDRPLLCVPMLALGDAVGVIHVERDEPSAFGGDEQRQVWRVAEQAALALANRRLIRTMESLAMTDPLTGISNARFFDPYLERELAAAKRDGTSLALIMLDIDRFKQFNDTHGHPAGDELLKAFGNAVRAALGSRTRSRVTAARNSCSRCATPTSRRRRRSARRSASP